MSDKRLIITQERCNGCKSCELACAFAHRKKDGRPSPSYIKAYSYDDDISVVVVCQQCDDAACVRACPSGALALNEQTGVVEYDKKKCMNSGMCAVACPFGNIIIDPETKEVLKCDLCQGDPFCAKFCPTKALEYADKPSPKPEKVEIQPLPSRPWNLKPPLLKWRRYAQVGLGVIFTNHYINAIWTKTLYDGPLRSICVPGLNCHSCPFATLACPIGIMQSFASNHQFPFYVFGYVALIGILFGRAACGWICPFGWIQDMMFKIRSRKFGIPKFLKHLRWVSLILLVIILPYITGVHWFSKLCPYGGLIGAIPWALWNPINPAFDQPAILPGEIGFWFWTKMVILAGFLLWMVFATRPFCRTVCPMGLIFSWFNKISFLKLEIPKPQCSGCEKCDDLCPMGLDVTEEIESSNCIKCLDCTACDHIQAKFTLRSGFIRDRLLKAVEKVIHSRLSG
ncbi:4Fe-4S binding protein [bacterium]|nr:4Fe-4S binding protein [FCB group bacterium]MBL7191101.1 4Fe-4S binding protein [bacterium]